MTAEVLLRLEHVTKRYGSFTALDDFSVDVPRGLTGLVGANRAGKTTTFRLVLGIARPTAGTVSFAGHDVAADPIPIRFRLGYMPEHDCLPLDQSAADVVAMPAELSGAAVARRPTTGVGRARPRRTRRGSVPPDRRLLDRDAAAGQAGPSDRRRSRTGPARRTDRRPDPMGREEMLQLIARLGEFGISVLMSTHLLDDVQQVCSHVVMIDSGRLVVSGATTELLDSGGSSPSTSEPIRSGSSVPCVSAASTRDRTAASWRSQPTKRTRCGARHHRRRRTVPVPTLDQRSVTRRRLRAPGRGDS
ncbi:MAG: ATP-binding cassette domain-containing protein [Ilumatobacteraceae bacterium]